MIQTLKHSNALFHILINIIFLLIFNLIFNNVCNAQSFDILNTSGIPESLEQLMEIEKIKDKKNAKLNEEKNIFDKRSIAEFAKERLEKIKKSPLTKVAIKEKSTIYNVLTAEPYIVPSGIITQAHTLQDEDNFFYITGPKQDNYYRASATDITVLDLQNSIINLNETHLKYIPIDKEQNYKRNLQFVSFRNNLNLHFGRTAVETPSEVSSSNDISGLIYKLEEDLLMSSILPLNIGLSLSAEQASMQSNQNENYKIRGILTGPVIESIPIGVRKGEITLAVQFARSIYYDIEYQNEREKLICDYYAIKGKYLFDKNLSANSIFRDKLIGLAIFKQYFSSKDENDSGINFQNMQSIGATFFLGFVF
ncbi:MAG: hypothetical protein HQK49_21580 [Oligoflexia bacterium]|nr:hypothetical protein [Oligoflexia bacterium]